MRNRGVRRISRKRGGGIVADEMGEFLAGGELSAGEFYAAQDDIVRPRRLGVARRSVEFELCAVGLRISTAFSLRRDQDATAWPDSILMPLNHFDS